MSLCDKMSTLFLHYLAQPQEKLLDWLAKDGWQQSLWRLVLGPEIKPKCLWVGKSIFSTLLNSLLPSSMFSKK